MFAIIIGFLIFIIIAIISTEIYVRMTRRHLAEFDKYASEYFDRLDRLTARHDMPKIHIDLLLRGGEILSKRKSTFSLLRNCFISNKRLIKQANKIVAGAKPATGDALELKEWLRTTPIDVVLESINTMSYAMHAATYNNLFFGWLDRIGKSLEIDSEQAAELRANPALAKTMLEQMPRERLAA